ncbi:MAG: Gfo/Idh/MocA family oxidoreductase, partial [Planctomycetales bacterium]
MRMVPKKQTRRKFMQSSAAAALVPYGLTDCDSPSERQAKSDRPIVGCIGTGSRFSQLIGRIQKHASVAAVCDVDRKRGERARSKLNGTATWYEDYRRMLDRKDVEAVFITTPDHWHAKPAMEAMLAGKDVYCEKPLSLTIDEGKRICQTVRETGAVFQVGTQQRSEAGLRFLTAAAIVRAGRLGKIRQATCFLGPGLSGGPFSSRRTPSHLNWELWLGQAPWAEYVPERCHYTVRWWRDYSGGRVTDWGSHHVDAAMWAMDRQDAGPVAIQGTAEWPDVPGGYNTPLNFRVAAEFADGAEIILRHGPGNGVLFEGDQGRLFVNRGKLSGDAVQSLVEDPAPEAVWDTLCKGRLAD